MTSCLLTFRALDAVVWPEDLLVGRIPLKSDLVEHLDVLHVGVVEREPGGVQLPQPQIGEEGDVVGRMPVLAVQHLF